MSRTAAVLDGTGHLRKRARRKGGRHLQRKKKKKTFATLYTEGTSSVERRRSFKSLTRAGKYIFLHFGTSAPLLPTAVLPPYVAYVPTAAEFLSCTAAGSKPKSSSSATVFRHTRYAQLNGESAPWHHKAGVQESNTTPAAQQQQSSSSSSDDGGGATVDC